MSKKKNFQLLAGLAIAGLVSTTLGCGYTATSPALPIGDQNALLTPSAGALNTLPTGTVTGRVVDQSTNMGIPSALVEVQNVNPPVTGMTDSAGNFVLNGVPQGQQIIVLNRPGYIYTASQGSIIANVMPNTTISLPQITLTPSVAAASNAYITSFGGLTEPYGLAVDNNRGMLYAVDRVGLNSVLDKRSEVKKFNLTGGFVSRFGGKLLGVSRGNTGGLFDLFTHLEWAYGIDVDAGGNIYVADTSENRLVKFSAAGEYITKISTGLSNNYDVAVLNNNEVAASSGGNNQIVMFDVNLGQAGQDFQGTASAPQTNGGLRGMCVDNANFVYVLDNSGGPGAAVRKYDTTTSNLVLQFGTNNGSGPSQFRGATDIAVDNRNGDIYVVDAGNNRVERFDRNGAFVSEFGSAGAGNAQFNNPYGIAIDNQGYIYVSDTGNKRIEKFAPGQLNNAQSSITPIVYPTK